MILAAPNYQAKIIFPEQAIEFRQQGYTAADLHTHTFYSHDVLRAEANHPCVMWSRARQKGMDFVSFTDHDTMAAYDAIGWQRYGIIPGVEIRISDLETVGHTIHVNVYCLNPQQFDDIKFIAARQRNLPTLVDYLNKHDLPYVYNHPFWFEANDVPNIKVIPKIAELFPVLEYNMHRISAANELTVTLAERLGKGIIACTDTHVGDIGKAYTLARGDTFREYFKHIANGDAFLVAQDLTPNGFTEEIHIWLDNIFTERVGSEGKGHFTGVGSLDRLIESFSQNGLRDSIVGRLSSHMFRLLAHSGFPSFLYLQNQRKLAKKISEELNLPLSVN